MYQRFVHPDISRHCVTGVAQKTGRSVYKALVGRSLIPAGDIAASCMRQAGIFRRSVAIFFLYRTGNKALETLKQSETRGKTILR